MNINNNKYRTSSGHVQNKFGAIESIDDYLQYKDMKDKRIYGMFGYEIGIWIEATTVGRVAGDGHAYV